MIYTGGTIKILNLYACLGGNRYKWDEVADIQVTAVENDPELARLYKERFPNDIVIVGDAHQYLLDHFKEYHVVWSSPPCPTHSTIRVSQMERPTFEHKYPDLRLYEEIIFLMKFFKGRYCVENVSPYYDLLIPGIKRGRHIYWTNFKLPYDLGERKEGKGLVCSQVKDEIGKLSKFHDYDFYKYNGEQRRDKISRNLVDYEVGKTIFETINRILQNKPVPKIGLFDTQ